MGRKNIATKQGAASLYVVIFAAMLFMVIITSFVRLTVSEIKNTSGTDISQSAYDAAMAGVEDAKTSLQKCLSLSGTNREICLAGLIGEDCNKFTGKEEEQFIGRNETSESVEDEAYTCVTISNEIDSYRDTLDSDHDVQIVPIDSAGNVESITLNWAAVASETSSGVSSDYPRFPDADHAPNPPVLSVTVVKNDNKNRTVILYPSSGGSGDINDVIEKSSIVGELQNPFEVNCNGDDNAEFKCSVTIVNSGIQYLVVAMPYTGQRSTDYEVVQNGDDGLVTFKNVQFVIDSTGRSNSYYRRVRTYVEYGDPNYPIPKNALTLGGGVPDDDHDNNLDKNFYVTKNCFKADNGKTEKCENYGKP